MELDLDELIKRLTEIRNEHGNTRVLLRNTDNYYHVIDNVTYHDLTTYINY